MIVFDNSQLLISTANYSVMAVVMVQLSLQLFVC